MTFQLENTPGGTDVTVTHYDVPRNDFADVKAGLVSVLPALKAYADFGIDLRNHSGSRNWDRGYVDN